MSHGRFRNPVSASLAGVVDFFRKQELASHLSDADRLDGKTCLVTGANRGLGYAIASELASRGGRVIMACRSGIPEAGDAIKAATGARDIEMIQVDLADMASITHFCEELETRQIRLDVLVLNAGITPPHSRQSPQGQDVMFMVNYLANFILCNRLIKAGVVGGGNSIPRIIFISSDSHQGASALDFEEFGRYTAYGVSKAINNYSYFKLMLNTFASFLSHQINTHEQPQISINVICPGPVNTDIIREAPLILRAIMRVIFGLFFQAPAKAARPVAYLAASAEMADTSNIYLAMFNRKDMDPKCYDLAEGGRLWEASIRVWKSIDPQADAWLLPVLADSK